RIKSYYLGNKKTIVRRKSSLSTFPPCLPGPAFTDNIKNLPLSGPQSPVPNHQILQIAYFGETFG
ncbi:hypothetical protein, partial [Sphaerospermopsis aphanizomenoides]|uniref:hypothetical protein n=1 Tax=Sphaerospermopsis aphanizomenoides TaxID=459663 RepID=UPI001D15C014